VYMVDTESRCGAGASAVTAPRTVLPSATKGSSLGACSVACTHTLTTASIAAALRRGSSLRYNDPLGVRCLNGPMTSASSVRRSRHHRPTASSPSQLHTSAATKHVNRNERVYRCPWRERGSGTAVNSPSNEVKATFSTNHARSAQLSAANRAGPTVHSI